MTNAAKAKLAYDLAHDARCDCEDEIKACEVAIRFLSEKRDSLKLKLESLKREVHEARSRVQV